MNWTCSAYGDRRGACRVLLGNLRERDSLEETIMYGRIILKWIFKMLNGKVCTSLICLRKRTGDVSCKSGNEPSGGIKRRKFLIS
jgi:hypothetical protein